jgi:AcrR family transcriptional regulator
MVKAAYHLFCRHGYSGTTITAAAAAAGVAVPTVYYTFGTKAALLGESLGAAIVGFDRWREPPTDPIDMSELVPWHGWWAEFEAAVTSADALDIFIANGVDILQRVAPLVAAIHGASGDADAAEIIRVGEQRRAESYGIAVHVLAGKDGGLRPGLTVDAATDIVVVLFSAELYQAMAVGRGWSHTRCAAFFRDVLTSQLLGSDLGLNRSGEGSKRPVAIDPGGRDQAGERAESGGAVEVGGGQR